MSKEEKKSKVEEKPVEEKKENPEVEALKKQLEEMKAKFLKAEANFEAADKEKDEWKNKYYSAYADMSNLRKQVEKETADFKKYSNQSLIEEMIPTFDSFDMALKNEPKDEVVKNYVAGFKMIHNKLLNVLTQINVKIIDPKPGDEYDPHKMQAYSTVPGAEDNKIAEVFTKGYQLYEHLIRPAGVIVTVKEEKKEDKEVSNDSKEESTNK